MATRTIFCSTTCISVMLLFNVASICGSPVKRSTGQAIEQTTEHTTEQTAKQATEQAREQAPECYGRECDMDLNIPSDTITDVTLPENLTSAIMTGLPNIESMQNTTIALLTSMTTAINIASQSNNLLLQTMAQTMVDIANLLQNQLSLLGDRLPKLPPPRDCQDIAKGTYQSGPYKITPLDDMGSFKVYCDLDTDGGGWTVFQRRFNGTVDFYRGWDEYVQGFGSPDGEYWAGLEQIHRLTRKWKWVLRIDMESFDGSTEYAKYESFEVGDAGTHYRLSIGAYSGNGRDELSYHNNQPFTTRDSDHDDRSGNCAESWQGGWWYKSCHTSNLNGVYLGPLGTSERGMVWIGYTSLKRVEMKMRRVL